MGNGELGNVATGLAGLFFGLAVVLLGAVTAGVGYLTYSDWRDRRDRERLAARVDPRVSSNQKRPTQKPKKSGDRKG
ncbi:MAG: hypothetical protein HC918_13940 [Oscillatoriales cyanobacterium SM2_1_8]|nr:hypothetical protein [Oscillatoriales cyanobacterium SM2_1_8]